jgi:hypothetical protein
MLKSPAMCKAVTFSNRKYYRPYDNTDNECCWQIDEVSRDIDVLLTELGIDAESLTEDWGAAWSWFTNGIEHSMHLECTNVDTAEYQISYWALKRRWWFLKRAVSDEESDFGRLAPRLHQLGDDQVA